MSEAYYEIADGRQFIDFQAERLTTFMAELDTIEAHCLLSAAEHIFRQGRKPGTDQHDERAQEWWLGQARQRYMARKRLEWSGVKPFPVAKTESRFDLIVGNVFGNTIEQRELTLSRKRGKL